MPRPSLRIHIASPKEQIEGWDDESYLEDRFGLLKTPSCQLTRRCSLPSTPTIPKTPWKDVFIFKRKLSSPMAVEYPSRTNSRLPTAILHYILDFMDISSPFELTKLQLISRHFNKSFDHSHPLVKRKWEKLVLLRWGSLELSPDEKENRIYSPKEVYRYRYIQCELPVLASDKRLMDLAMSSRLGIRRELDAVLVKLPAQLKAGELQLLKAQSQFTSHIANSETELYRVNLFCSDPQRIKSAVTGYRQMLSVADNPHLDSVCTSGVIPRFVQLLLDPTLKTNHALRFELIWALTNICSGSSEHVQMVTNAGAIPVLIAVLNDSSLVLDDLVVEQALWALGNICGESPHFCQMVLDHEPLPLIMARLLQPGRDILLMRTAFLRNTAWFLSNCVRSSPALAVWKTRHVVRILGRFVLHEDRYVLSDSIWGLSYIASQGEEQARRVLDHVEVDCIKRLLLSTFASVSAPMLITLENLFAASAGCRQRLLLGGILNALKILVDVSSKARTVAAAQKCVVALASGWEFDQVAFMQSHPQALYVLRKSV